VRVSFVGGDVFHGFIAVAPVKIRSGPLQPRLEWGGMLELGGAGPRPARSIRPDSSEPRRVDTKPLTTGAPSHVWGTRQGIGLSHRGDLGLTPPGYDLPPLRGFNQAPRRLVRAGSPDPPVLYDRSLRPAARHLETHGRPNGGVGRTPPNDSNSQRQQSGSEGGQDQLCSMPRPH